jgi:hypothetical protein
MPEEFDREADFDSGIEEIVLSMLRGVHTSMPAKVISFDAEKQTCSVQPVLMRKRVDQDAQPLPVIEEVPVVYPGSGDYWITFPLVADSYVLLVFSERALDAWLQEGDVIDPAKRRFFALSDAIAIPGLNPYPSSISPAVETDGLTIRKKDNSSYIKMKSSGQVDINGNFTVDT